MSYRKLPASALVVDGRSRDVRVYRATTFVSRGLGLLFSEPLSAREALWIAPCNSVHTFGMRYGIDVLFLDRQRRVIAERIGLQPAQWAACRRAASVLELPAGSASRFGIQQGAMIELEAA